MAKRVRTAAKVTSELADKIEKGRSLLKEVTYSWIIKEDDDDVVCGCAIGMAYAGHVGDVATAYRLYNNRRIVMGDIFIQKNLYIPSELFWAVSDAHCGGTKAAILVKRLRKGKFDKFVYPEM